MTSPPLVCFLLTILTATSAAAAPARPKSIILIIGDGMGPAHFTAAQLLRPDESRLGTFPVTGLVTTGCADSVVTDSAAAATALACGVTTKYRYVGVDRDGKPVRSVLEEAERTGRSTGLVTTANFYDATPAAFASHIISRYETTAIARQMLQSGAEIIVGGGAAVLGTGKVPTLESLTREYGYKGATSLQQLNAATGPKILGVFPTQPNEVDFPTASLPELASWAIERLALDNDGFFLMLEHEGTDGSSHNNATAEFEASVRSFDETVNVALEFANRRSDVLVVITGDHETGGLMIAPEKIGAPLEFRWSVGTHTGEMVPIFAKGPGAESFGGLMHNSEVGKRLMALVAPASAGRKATITLKR